MKTLVSAFLYILLPGVAALAEVLTVPGQYESIDQAILNSSDGDTVLVSPGVYSEHIDYRGKGIVVASHYIIDSSMNTIKNTVICGFSGMNPDTGTVITFQSGETDASILEGFTVRSGFGTLIADSYVGGGILCLNNSNPTICHNIIRDNNAINGGGCAFLDSDPGFFHNKVLYNNALLGGGVYLDNSGALMDHNIFAYNSATEDGGAVYIFLSDGPEIRNSVILSNNSAAVGGISCFLSYPLIEFNDLFNNQSANFGDCGEGFGDTLACFNFNLIPADTFFNFSRDPGFISPQSGDFFPQGNSPLIDAGSESNPDFPWSGFRNDIGLYEVRYLVGDGNADKQFNVSDVIYLINYIFQDSAVPNPFFSGDFNCDRKLNLVDVSQMINYIFRNGPGPCAYLEWQPQCSQ